MRRVLILCSSDWMSARARAATDYLHAVGAHMAGEGHVVTWLCAGERTGFFLTESRPPIELVDGIQVARLGPRLLYGKLARVVLSRLKKRGKLGTLYDTIVTCVEGRPPDLGEDLDVPVLPVVFRLSPSVRGASDPPGPLVAACEEAYEALLGAGFPERFVIEAPFGASIPGGDGLENECPDAAEACARSVEPSTLVALSDSPGFVMRAVELMDAAVRPATVEFIGRKRPRGNKPGVGWHPRTAGDERAALYAKCAVAYCGAGYEHEALSLGGARVAAICPATKAAREYVEDEETGLVCRAENPRGLAEALTRLVKDEVLRRRLAVRARKRAETQTWTQTAERVLAAVKSL